MGNTDGDKIKDKNNNCKMELRRNSTKHNKQTKTVFPIKIIYLTLRCSLTTIEIHIEQNFPKVRGTGRTHTTVTFTSLHLNRQENFDRKWAIVSPYFNCPCCSLPASSCLLAHSLWNFLMKIICIITVITTYQPMHLFEAAIWVLIFIRIKKILFQKSAFRFESSNIWFGFNCKRIERNFIRIT